MSVRGVRTRRAAAVWCDVGRVVAVALVLLVALALGGCEDGTIGEVEDNAMSALVVDQKLPEATVAGKPWAQVACTSGQLGADVLACVDGVAVTRAAFDRLRAQAPASVDNRSLVDALVRAEVLAGAAMARGLWADWLLEPLRSALVRRLLVRQFLVDFGPEQVQQKDIERAWIRGPIRTRYAHENAYVTIDAQFLCCTGDWRRCEIDAQVAACAERMAPQAQALAAELAADPPRSKSEFRGRVLALKHRFPDAALQEVSFYYDPGRAYDEQGEYDKMLEPWTMAVIALQPGQLSTPIRTAYGWHVVRLNEMLPKKEGKPTDPDVKADISRGILDGVRERDILIFAAQLMRQRGVQIFYDNLAL